MIEGPLTVPDSVDYIVIFITVSTNQEANAIADILVQERKAACVNIVPGLQSKFWWQGKMESADESLLIVKTKAAILDSVIDRVKQIHSYDVPEIIALPVIGGNEDYLNWIQNEVTSCQE